MGCYDQDGNPTYDHVHVFWGVFGLRFNDLHPAKGTHIQVELYIEDDGDFHYKCVFDANWLKSLARVTAMAVGCLEFGPGQYEVRLKDEHKEFSNGDHPQA